MFFTSTINHVYRNNSLTIPVDLAGVNFVRLLSIFFYCQQCNNAKSDHLKFNTVIEADSRLQNNSTVTVMITK